MVKVYEVVLGLCSLICCTCWFFDYVGNVEAGVVGLDLVCAGREDDLGGGGGFEQKTDKFWEYDEHLNSWVELKLPFDLFSCHNENCTKVGTVHQQAKLKKEQELVQEQVHEIEPKRKDASGNFIAKPVEGAVGQKMDHRSVSFPWRKRVSLIKLSDTSIWITGASGSIYERYWNGLQWVNAPHDLPASAGRAVSIFIINQTILALSEAGNLYQLQLNEILEPVWQEFIPLSSGSTNGETSPELKTRIKTGVSSNDGKRLYFCSSDWTLLELIEMYPQRWVNHGRPSGAEVAAISHPAASRPDNVFTISSSGDLYEFDRSSKPSWKKHVWLQGSTQEVSLQPATGCSLHGLRGPQSMSLFLLTKDGHLVERLLHKRKWKWLVHGSPKHHLLKAVMPVSKAPLHDGIYSIFFTTAAGYVFEYRMRKKSGTNQENKIEETWVNHGHPKHAKPVSCASGLELQVGRMLFSLDDGRLAELHLRGIGGENSGPNSPLTKKKVSHEYVWSVLETPETEGWNAGYCTEERGPSNCITGTKDGSGYTRARDRRKNGNNNQQGYSQPKPLGSTTLKSLENYALPKNWTSTNFRLRMMHSGRSFFLITESGFIFEYLCVENIWLWVKHDHQTPMRGALANYNMSLYFVDRYGSLMLRERNGNELTWINCTDMRKGKKVNGGPPWDRIVDSSLKATADDALFFISKTGRLIQFTVAQKNFRWKDCKFPQNIKIACIVDQEILRDNIIFVSGRNGQLYQYNKITEQWHEHYQSQHLVISKFPGTAVRVSSKSLHGSLFLISEDGGLVEYRWNAMDGWNWIEHGKPCGSVTLVGSPGPCFEGSQLFLIGSDGNVYVRYLTENIWKWRHCAYPFRIENTENESDDGGGEVNTCSQDQGSEDTNSDCDPKASSTRPIPFSEDTVIFELRDGRLAELKRVGDSRWVWSRIIGTPTSSCRTSYWTTLEA